MSKKNNNMFLNNNNNEQMTCPSCRGEGCRTCGREGKVPAWLADPAVNEKARAWTEE
jgi:hypothetical protein